jgi:DNA-binding response OmpR family regulator
LEASPKKYDVVILDRKMPGMSGMDVLIRMKNHDILKMIPVIFQTSMAAEKDILEGLQAGVDYYLIKPCKKEMLLAVIKTALSGYFGYKSMQKEVRQITDALGLIKIGHFEFQTIKQGKKLATLLASISPDPEKAVMGLWELFLNAIEHGNLGITYKEKSELIEQDKWLIEVERRMQLPENISKSVTVQVKNLNSEIRFLIQDQGPGFRWQSFLELSPERAFDAHGRGIAVAMKLSFDRIEYLGIGNRVLAVIRK